MGADQREANEIEARLRDQLEEVAEALNLGVGNTRLLLAFEHGRLRWLEPTWTRVPPSRIEELAGR